ncbi:HPr-rel-A system PqqD family peptide chaperone [uncultured Sphingomonas sp.]|uniref:HPr-rel-A system PqqD family peptide chaperone n=1 Tax=uncultured Sphingomonas sp. TaxID=158754 RepID=UPI0035C99435
MPVRYAAPPADAILVAELDAFTALFHRASGITHLLVSPAPEIIGALSVEPLSLDALLAALTRDYDLAVADPVALAARVDELVAAGLVSVA